MPYANVLGNLAWGFILALGIIAALNQLHIAQNVLNAVLYAALAALAGIAIVAVGGGGIKTNQRHWPVPPEPHRTTVNCNPDCTPGSILGRNAPGTVRV